MLREMEAGGWETGGHGLTHENLSSVSPAEARRQITGCDTFLRSNGLSHRSYAYAFGNYNDSVASWAADRFPTIRTSHDYHYRDGIDRRELGYFAVKNNHTVDDCIARVEQARIEGAPLVIIGFHVVLPDSAPALPVYWCRERVFRGFVAYCARAQLQVMTIDSAMCALGL
jgi:peptidoglycan/xylan/chitin deacetylase (PgdA/CDA1 family)